MAQKLIFFGISRNACLCYVYVFKYVCVWVYVCVVCVYVREREGERESVRWERGPSPYGGKIFGILCYLGQYVGLLGTAYLNANCVILQSVG